MGVHEASHCMNSFHKHVLLFACTALDRETERPRGFCHVDFVSPAAAAKAAQTLNQTDLDGRTIKVEVAQPRGERSTVRGFLHAFVLPYAHARSWWCLQLTPHIALASCQTPYPVGLVGQTSAL